MICSHQTLTEVKLCMSIFHFRTTILMSNVNQTVLTLPSNEPLNHCPVFMDLSPTAPACWRMSVVIFYLLITFLPLSPQALIFFVYFIPSLESISSFPKCILKSHSFAFQSFYPSFCLSRLSFFVHQYENEVILYIFQKHSICFVPFKNRQQPWRVTKFSHAILRKKC